MPDWDAVIIGGGPAGLTAGLYLCRGNWRTLLIEKETVGGYIMNVEYIENYPGFPEGVVGSQLGMDMKNQAIKYGLKTERNEVLALDVSPGNKTISCADGTTYTASAVIIAGGSVPKKLGVPGEDKLRGSGVISCAFCDGGQFNDQVVAVMRRRRCRRHRGALSGENSLESNSHRGHAGAHGHSSPPGQG